jgi:tRNA nucleotidyltransferase (CCA-adding enzyme)
MQIYLVGGAVRDKLLDFPVFDKDWLVVGATVEEMLALNYQQVGQDFPVFIHPKTGEEYALARTERKSGKGYTGFQYHADPSVTLEEDLLRRDLTINAMAMDDDEHIYDPYNGQQDLINKQLRHVSPAFSEDPLRVLRVARFAARYHHLGFSIADETIRLMTTLSTGDELEHLTPERVWKEFERALSEPSPWIFLQVLEQCKGINKVLPELSPCFNHVDDAGQGKKPNNTMAAFTSVCQKTDSAIVRFACLLSLAPNLKIKTLCERVRTPNLYKELALYFKKHHHQLAQFNQIDANEKLKIILHLDLIRRPQRLPLLLECLNALHSSISLTHLTPILDLIAQIQPKQLMAEGFKGPALGEAINQRRLAICEQFTYDN